MHLLTDLTLRHGIIGRDIVGCDHRRDWAGPIPPGIVGAASLAGARPSLTGSRALSRSGKKVLHLDKNPYYGGSEAAFSLDEAQEWMNHVNQRGYLCFLPSGRELISNYRSSSVSIRGCQNFHLSAVKKLGVHTRLLPKACTQSSLHFVPFPLFPLHPLTTHLYLDIVKMLSSVGVHGCG